MEKLNWKKMLILCLPIVFAVSLAITLAACMAQAGRGLDDSAVGDGTGGTGQIIPVGVPAELYSEGLKYISNGNGSCALAGIGECTGGEIRVPPESPGGDIVTSVADSAFFGCTVIESVLLPDTVKSVGSYAFYGSSLKSVNIPDGVTVISECAFSDCGSLTAISVDSGNTVYSSLDGVLFSKDKCTLICYPSGKQNESYTIRRGVTVIAAAAFYNCRYLKEVSFNGSAEEWAKLRIGNNNGSLTSLTIKYLTAATK